MSYATLSNGNSGYHGNIYDNIREHEELYDSPYEQTSHYEPSPVARRNSRATVTINGVAVQWDVAGTVNCVEAETIRSYVNIYRSIFCT